MNLSTVCCHGRFPTRVFFFFVLRPLLDGGTHTHTHRDTMVPDIMSEVRDSCHIGKRSLWAKEKRRKDTDDVAILVVFKGAVTSLRLMDYQ